MKRRSAEVKRLAAELKSDLEMLAELQEKNIRAWSRIQPGSEDELDWAALGYTIHNIYNLLENYFLRISKFFENTLDSDSWNKDLVKHMSLELEGIRPALFDRRLALRIDELRAFRHIFRNIYQAELDPKRVQIVQQDLPKTLDLFRNAHTRFLEKLELIAASLDGQ